MDVIHVGLYGGKGIFGGKEVPQRAETIMCDKYKNCTYYNSGQCFNVTSPFSSRCKYGKVVVAHGYTSRAKKYYDFDSTYRKHEKYHQLEHPPTKIGIIDNEVVFPYSFIRVIEKEGKYIVDNPSFGNNIAFIPLDLFTEDLINNICNFRPQAIMGGEIKDYQNKTVPLFLAHLKEVIPQKYDEYIKKYKSSAKTINYIGRKALLKTISPSLVSYKSDRYPEFNEDWYWDGELLTHTKGYVHSPNITKNYEIVSFQLRPTDKSSIIISDNLQINDNTVFLD